MEIPSSGKTCRTSGLISSLTQIFQSGLLPALKDYHWSGESESISVWFSTASHSLTCSSFDFSTASLAALKAWGAWGNGSLAWPGLVVDLLPLFRRNLADFCEAKSIANLDTRCICRFNIIEKPVLISYSCPTFSTFSIFSWTSLTLANNHQVKQSSCDSCAMIFCISVPVETTSCNRGTNAMLVSLSFSSFCATLILSNFLRKSSLTDCNSLITVAKHALEMSVLPGVSPD